MSDFLRLAELCEQASGPSRDLDRQISLAVRARVQYKFYTSSIDAALTLVPDGYGYILITSESRVGGTSADVTYEGHDAGDWRDHRNGRCERHSHAAIALCIAALRARAARPTPPAASREG